MVRKAMFAGSFYEGNPAFLKKEIEQWFEQAQVPKAEGRICGIICPHAGYMYSGSCAAHSYKFLSQVPFTRAVIIHPSHRGNHFGYSLSPFTEYQTPLGDLKVSRELDELLASGSDNIDPWYHVNEHSMEVQLPFIKYINPDAEILPVLLGNQCDKISKQLADKLFPLFKDKNDKTVIVVSSDLSHYLSAQEAESMDGKLIEHILADDIGDFYHSIATRRTEACGFGGILTLMYLAKMITGAKFYKLRYTHSGEASGDYGQVVGYLSAALLIKD
ncbi:MAG TPA: AmmeMemoRadiSam system protein B [Candidatus Cloacimonadota bacterium]|nr:AmmeMemoRadiSam system protein B [Candidatus Cloacimonadota bacterium]